MFKATELVVHNLFCFSRAFGAKPLEDVIKNLRAVVMSELENALAQQAPPIKIEDPSR